MSTATASAAERAAQREQQMKQGEELMALVAEREGVAKGLFWGKFVADWIFPYPKLSPAAEAEVRDAVAVTTKFCDEELDPVRIDREADIPKETIAGLARIGVLGMTAPKEIGGRGFSQMGYGKILEVIGGRCSSTAIFVNAHHSIGMRALLLFGTEAQKRQWLPDMVVGKKLGAFALTEPQAGSDAANVQTKATPTEDGSAYILSGEKRYITNGAIADVLTVMARTPVPGKSTSAITAFLVTPDMPGFRVVEARKEKLGIRGTATGQLAFENMRVPKENILGPLGKGLKVALTVLDFGRTTFGACCTGAAKTCVKLAVEHATTRRQFNKTLSEFELVRQKLVRMHAWTYAMEAMTNVTAGLIDRGLEDYMLETAMLKVWSTERLWTIVNDAFQIHGGAAYFTDKPLERLLRDHRINQIGEGANEVLLSFIALSGMRKVGLYFKDVYEAVKKPWAGVGTIAGFMGQAAKLRVSSPPVPVSASELQPYARRLSKLIAKFGAAVQTSLIRHREPILDMQLEQERLAGAAMELFATACVLSRWDSEISQGAATQSGAARWFVEDSLNLAERNIRELNSPIDKTLRKAADQILGA
ncbi:MAG TPA: acyl-CoA dehydrogenase family protein [Planctomycetia bacterium]|nr:acyl-CoA dehydrogenase family protein [Planctomycetia bacterium]